MSFSCLPPPSLLLLLLLLSLKTSNLCNASDSITPAQPLTGTQTITSKGGRFELGFFAPSKSSQSQRYYIGIWYKQVTKQTAVWVANRDTPLPNTTNSILKISEDGNLVLLSPSNSSIWSTNFTSTASSSNSTVAVLLDTGNLVLRDGNDPSIVHWESFAHPTDTFLPGSWIGIRNRTTGQNARLISWKSQEDPAPGPFSYEIDLNQSQFLMFWNGSRIYYRTGVWNGDMFADIPEMESGFKINFEFVDNQTAKYFTYYLEDPSGFAHGMIDVSGQIKSRDWLGRSNQWYPYWSRPKFQCAVFAVCGAFGSCDERNNPSYCSCLPGFIPKIDEDWDLGSWSEGCTRRTPLLQQVAANSTANMEADRFWVLPAMKQPANSQSFSAATSVEECKLACLGDRSCTAYAFESGCSIWSGDLVDVQQLSDGDANRTTLFLRLAASEVPTSKSKKGMIAGITAGSVAGLAFALSIALFLVRRYRRQRQQALMKAVARGSLVAFGYRDLQSVTKNFSERLGGGGFGSVFKGTLPDLSTVAVKMLEGLCQGEKQFRMEVSTIGTIQHVNLIRLRGFCSDGDKKLLVYDYMPNGSLNSHLFGTQKKCLDWSRRYQIAIETARGLAYLHEKCRDCIIHCDIKPENILLDDGFGVKIADFGLAKLFGRDFSHVLTTLRGTVGYLAPEWLSGLAITTKADVYSYGMMLFEIISGRRNREESVKGQTMFFPTWAMSKMSEGDMACLLDDRLEGNADMEEVNRACRVAGWCIQDHENERPSMGHIVQILEGVLEVNVPPMPRLLQILDANSDMISSPMLSSSVPSEIKSGSLSPSSKV
ncbi:hypothetical protein ACLOJK_020600 [Asimina triloba]